MPTTPETVGAYLADAGLGYASPTLRRRVTAIARAHRIARQPLDTRLSAIHETVRGDCAYARLEIRAGGPPRPFLGSRAGAQAGVPRYWPHVRLLNDAAVGYMRDHALPAALIARLAEQPQTSFADQPAWNAHLDRLGFTALTTTPNPVQIATEGALWGSIYAHALLRDTVVLSDDAGQFAVGRHTLCWVHAERLVHKLEAFNDANCAAQKRVRPLIWDFYADLKAYRAGPNKRRRLALLARFDRIFRRRTGFVSLDRLLARLHANKAELLMVLDRPETPLNTNGSKNDIRSQVNAGLCHQAVRRLRWPGCRHPPR